MLMLCALIIVICGHTLDIPSVASTGPTLCNKSFPPLSALEQPVLIPGASDTTVLSRLYASHSDAEGTH